MAEITGNAPQIKSAVRIATDDGRTLHVVLLEDDKAGEPVPAVLIEPFTWAWVAVNIQAQNRGLHKDA